MGSIVRFARPRPVIRQSRRVPVESESVAARRSLFILIGSFFITAVVMCAAVVAMVASTWTDVLIMSAFVLVFALLKIVLANALIYTMLRYDAATADVPTRTRAIGRYHRFTSFRQLPVETASRTRSQKTGKLRVAVASRRPDPS
jgi:hypothetical protein